MTAKPEHSERYSTNLDPIQPRYLDSKQAARYLGLDSSVTLALWRKRGYGPPFVPIGRRGSNRYLYDKKDLDEWIEEQKLYPQYPHGLHSERDAGALDPRQVNKKPPAKKPKKKRKPPQEKGQDLHLVFRTVSEKKPDER